MDDFISIIYSISIIVVAIIIDLEIKNKTRNISYAIKKEIVNENSFQRYAKFYDNTTCHDDAFKEKVTIIYNCIVKEKKSNIKEIAERSNCTYEECILKIKYLKNKGYIGDYYIDHIEGTVLPCTKEDLILLKIYKKYVNNHHLQVDEIAARLPGTTIENLKEVSDKVLKDLMYLEKKDLINGIKINEVDKEIIYYDLEKKKKRYDIVTVSCPNCGALNDLNKGNKVRCEYCQSIVEAPIE